MRRVWVWLLLGVTVAAGAAFALGLFDPAPPKPPPARPADALPDSPIRLVAAPKLSLWWGVPPRGKPLDALASNVHPQDYVGPDACKTCHPNNHRDWGAHPHRWMNAPAAGDSVKGDFSGKSFTYRGGTAVFEKRNDSYTMTLSRGDVRRVYRITQTIGSRFFQYYAGRQLEGPEPPGHHFYAKDHVLPFGFWLSEGEWVPTVHIGPEMPDEQRPDPFHPPDSGRHYAEYAVSCNYCHTTFPLGDLFARRPHLIGEHAPHPMHWAVRDYLDAARPAERPAMETLVRGGAKTSPMADWEASKYAATFGVSCEACHLGGREHVASKGVVPPRFFPASRHLSVEAEKPADGRTAANLNWACGRCHTGTRPEFAGGMSTWNSVEYSDAVRGSCYSQLKCIDCHSPHTALGATWSVPPAKDDAVCLKCHERYTAPAARQAHTHHAPNTEGDRCLNCHMPRMHEGLNGVVRTHMIFSPTRADMLHADHPNACNICHTEKPIDWTLSHLKSWYGKTYDLSKFADRSRPVADGWLASDDEAVRLVAADALARAKGKAAVPRLLDALDDPFLLNRQFATKSLRDAAGTRAADFGYHFTQAAADRREPLRKLRAAVAPGTAPVPAPAPRPFRPSATGNDPR